MSKKEQKALDELLCETNLARYCPMLPYAVAEGYIKPEKALLPDKFKDKLCSEWDTMPITFKTPKQQEAWERIEQTSPGIMKDFFIGYCQAFYAREAVNQKTDAKYLYLAKALTASVSTSVIDTLRSKNISDDDIMTCFGTLVNRSSDIYSMNHNTYLNGNMSISINPAFLVVSNKPEYYGRSWDTQFHNFSSSGAATATEQLDAIKRAAYLHCTIPEAKGRKLTQAFEVFPVRTDRGM